MTEGWYNTTDGKGRRWWYFNVATWLRVWVIGEPDGAFYAGMGCGGASGTNGTPIETLEAAQLAALQMGQAVLSAADQALFDAKQALSERAPQLLEVD